MSEGARPPRKSRRVLKIFGGIVVLLLLAVMAVTYFALKPRNFTPLLLDQVGQATGLEITATGTSEINWQGTPSIVLRNLTARQPGAAKAVLTAERVLVAMPWMTLRSRGRSLVIDRVELDAPVLDLQAFRTWQDSRPASESRIPDFKRGILVTNGQVLGAGWRVEGVALQVPKFSMTQPVQGLLAGQFSNASLRMRFDLGLALTRPASGAGFGLNGGASVFSGDWALATRPRLKGVLSLDGGTVRLQNGTLGASAEYRTGAQIVPLNIGMHGEWLLNRDGLRLQPGQFALRGDGVVPNLGATGHVHVGEAVDVMLDGTLASWPTGWPALPSPFNHSTRTFDFRLAYDGDTNFSDPIALRLSRPDVRFDGRFKLNEVAKWASAMQQGTPVPPMDGRLSAPRMDVGDVQLQGVEIDIERD